MKLSRIAFMVLGVIVGAAGMAAARYFTAESFTMSAYGGGVRCDVSARYHRGECFIEGVTMVADAGIQATSAWRANRESSFPASCIDTCADQPCLWGLDDDYLVPCSTVTTRCRCHDDDPDGIIENLRSDAEAQAEEF